MNATHHVLLLCVIDEQRYTVGQSNGSQAIYVARECECFPSRAYVLCDRQAKTYGGSVKGACKGCPFLHNGLTAQPLCCGNTPLLLGG